MTDTCTIRIEPCNRGEETLLCADMLLRMYLKWVDLNNCAANVLERSGGPSDIKITGEGVYDRLHGEAGIHRISRISPIDPEGRRYTSFVTVMVLETPQASDAYDIQKRSYVFSPYPYVKDHVLSVEHEDVNGVINGDLSAFIPPGGNCNDQR